MPFRSFRVRLFLSLFVLVTSAGAVVAWAWGPDDEAVPALAAPNSTTTTAPTSTTTTTSTTSTTTTTVPVEPECVPPRTLDVVSAEPVPAGLAAELEGALAHPGFDDVRVGASVWVEGYGEVVGHGADVPLLPASVQKLATAMAALALLPDDHAFRTTVQATGPVVDGTLRGDLVVVGGGDPTLALSGPHSLDALAAAVADAGIVRVAGDVVADESRYGSARAAPGWQDWHVPRYAGPLSALMVDGNRHRTDAAYLADPAVGNTEVFQADLERRGVAVGGGVVGGVAPSGATTVASLSSPPVGELVDTMLLRSDNDTAEMLIREVGLVASGKGTTEAGTAAFAELAESWCLELDGVDGDGSGLSRANARSAGEWRDLIQAARSAPWWGQLRDGLPVAAESGTLRGRFAGTAAAGDLRAKTGTILEGRALAGVFTTDGGRTAVFSVLTNGDGSSASGAAIDNLVTTVAADRS